MSHPAPCKPQDAHIYCADEKQVHEPDTPEAIAAYLHRVLWCIEQDAAWRSPKVPTLRDTVLQLKAADLENEATGKLLAEKGAELERVLRQRDSSHQGLKVAGLCPCKCMLCYWMPSVTILIMPHCTK